MKAYILFGIASPSLDEARREVEAVLDIRMTLHDSSYHGGAYYRCGLPGGEHFILQKNFDDLEHDWTEPEFSGFPTLMYANETERGAELETRMKVVAVVLSVREL